MQTPRDRIQWAREQFTPAGAYLDTATAGLPPRAAWTALQQAQERWRTGTANAVAYDEPIERSRTMFAALAGVEPGDVALGSQASVFVGVVASSLPEGAEVLTVEGDFTSVLFPFHALRRGRIKIREVPLERLVDSVGRSTYLVAVSAVQSRSGAVVDLEALHRACQESGSRTLLDTTQAVGWLPVDADRFTYTVTGGYKWLLAARGTAFLTVGERDRDDLTPFAAGWYAGEDPWRSIYGTPMRLARSAKRFDLSPAWHSWVTQAPALDLLTTVGRRTLHSNAVHLSTRFCEALDLPASGSAIVSLAVDDDAAGSLAEHGVRASVRDGRLRLAFHISTTEDDVDLAVDALRGHVLPEGRT